MKLDPIISANPMENDVTDQNWSVESSLYQGFIASIFTGTHTIAEVRDYKAACAMAAAPKLLEALEETWRVLRAAGLHNLTNGVQLGQTSWFIKISDAEELSNAAIAKAKGETR